MTFSGATQTTLSGLKSLYLPFKPTSLLWEAQLGCALHCKTLPGCYGLIHKTWAGLRTSSCWGTPLTFVKTGENLLFFLILPLHLCTADIYQHHRWIMSPNSLKRGAQGKNLLKSQQHWVKLLVPTCWEFKCCICSKYTFFPFQTQPGKGAALCFSDPSAIKPYDTCSFLCFSPQSCKADLCNQINESPTCWQCHWKFSAVLIRILAKIRYFS